jgi:hypothetical protein
MKIQHKLIVILVLLFVSMNVFSVTEAFGALIIGNTFEVDNIVYRVTGDTPGSETCEVSNTITSQKSVVIDEFVEYDVDGTDYRVTRIGFEAFKDSDKIIGIYADFVAEIGDRAFLLCRNLDSVSLPEATTIDDYAFAGCINLEFLTLHANPPDIGYNIFYDTYVSNLTILTLGNPSIYTNDGTWLSKAGLDTAQFKQSFIVTFNANGGVVSPAKAITDVYGKIILPTPTYAGYIFDGWPDFYSIKGVKVS